MGGAAIGGMLGVHADMMEDGEAGRNGDKNFGSGGASSPAAGGGDPGPDNKNNSSKEANKENRQADSIKNQQKLDRQMEQRGWTQNQVEEAIQNGKQYPATNNQTGGAATRYVHPETGRSVVIDNSTKGIIHVGGDGFIY